MNPESNFQIGQSLNREYETTFAVCSVPKADSKRTKRLPALITFIAFLLGR